MTFGLSVVLVSGASRGIGAEICVQVASKCTEGSVMIGLARDAEKLAQTKAAVSEKGVEFIPVIMDLAKLDIASFESAIKDALAKVAARGPLLSAILVHNAGSLGGLRPITQITDMKAISAYFDFNLGSLYPMNASFLALVQQEEKSCQIKVINMTSLSGIKPMQTFGLYCTGKAARDMLFKVLALEHPDIKVLSYSPGPVDTDMLAEAMAAPNEEMQAVFKKMEADKSVLTCAQTVGKMVGLMETGDFESGDHVDYFDRE